MTGYEYEQYCVNYLQEHGYTNVIRTPGSGDQGIDIIAEKNNIKYGIQCKYYSRPVGNKAVQEACAGALYYDCSKAAVMTNSTFTDSAKQLANKTQVALWDGIDPFLPQSEPSEKKHKFQSTFLPWCLFILVVVLIKFLVMSLEQSPFLGIVFIVVFILLIKKYR